MRRVADAMREWQWPVDPYFANVELLVNMGGADGSTTFTDVSKNAFVITTSGNAQIDDAVQVNGVNTCLLDGSGDFLFAPNSEALRVRGDDFTLETFIRVNTLGRTQTIANKRDGGGAEEFSWAVNGANVLVLVLFSGGSAVAAVNGATALTTGQVYHVAATRQGDTFSLWLDGVLDGSVVDTSATASTNGAAFKIGRDGFNSSRDFDGWIGPFRFTKGICRYTEPFTPHFGPFPQA